MDKLFVRKDVYEEILEKGFGKKDMSKLTKKQITDKNGHTRTVYVRNGEQPVQQQQPKAQEELSDERRAKYEEMLEKVKAGPDERALFVRGEFLNKKDAIAHLESKLGKKSGKESKPAEETKKPQMTDEDRFEVAVENSGRDIREENKINSLSDKIEFSPEEMKAISEAAKQIDYKPGNEMYLINTIYDKNKDIYHSLYDKNQKVWKESGKQPKTFSGFDLIEEKLKSMKGKFDVPEESGSIEDDDTSAKTFEDAIKNYNFDKEKKEQFAMNEVAKFYPDLKDAVENRRKAFYAADEARKKLDVNPNNETYKENFKNAVNDMNKATQEYQSAAEKALEKAPDVPKPSFDKYVEARRKVDKIKDNYKKKLETYEVANRLREGGASSILDPMYGLKPDDYTKDSDFINAQMTIRAYEGK